MTITFVDVAVDQHISGYISVVGDKVDASEGMLTVLISGVNVSCTSKIISNGAIHIAIANPEMVKFMVLNLYVCSIGSHANSIGKIGKGMSTDGRDFDASDHMTCTGVNDFGVHTSFEVLDDAIAKVGDA